VSVSNGCKDSISREVQVLDQSIPDFSSIANACSGDDFDFKNNTVVKSGSLASFHWDFGDNTTSDAESPKKTILGKKYNELQCFVESERGERLHG